MTAPLGFRNIRIRSSRRVARIGYEGWKGGKVLVVPGMTNRFGVALVRVSPRSIVRKRLK